MNNRLPKSVVVGLVAGALLLALVSLWFAGQPAAERTDGMRVAATVFPIYDIARNVAGDTVQVDLVLPTSAEPHTYEPTPSAMRTVEAAAVVYAVGHNLDGWLSGLTEATGTPTLVVDAGIELLPATHDHHHDEDEEGEEGRAEEGLPEEHGDEESALGADPHYWLSVPNAAAIARTVAADLIARFPDRAADLAANLRAYEDKLSAADHAIHDALDGLQDRRLATFHGAYRYFARDYNLEIAIEFEPFPGREPSALYLSEIGAAVAEHGLSTIYREPNMSAAAVSVFASDHGLSLGILDPLGGTAPERSSLIDTLTFNAHEIARLQR
jgi:zinc transport system substrate-binding protein